MVSSVDRVGRPASSGECSRLGVALVADRLLGQHRRGVGAELGGAARGALLRAGGEEHLDARRRGATTVPMSRPSATQSPRASRRRCSATIASRTAGIGGGLRGGLGDLRGADLGS